jgi:hypothetical protein
MHDDPAHSVAEVQSSTLAAPLQVGPFSHATSIEDVVAVPQQI